ncbi:zinc finger MYM-type protein 1-like [Helianthus annuus]|uniref:zinc finger MYM-type protein 1-like n=1 Tax=Helianthus annuus TaxID=4232 RepID=UPI000B902C25|nr:zinc finger MYM-type protein 1-like [Helianthus annuus]
MSHGHDTFTVKGFDNWNKVCGKQCAFMKHIKTSHHRDALLFSQNLLNQEAHVDNSISKPNKEIIMKNRSRLKTTADVVRWLTYQACALRGHDESASSKNRGNFLELLTLLASYNDEVSKVILENAPYNAKYTSEDIQKEILSIIANKIQKHIRSEVGDSAFCVMVDESRDESKKEQMAIVVRFVDEEGMIQERFLDLVNVRDTLSVTLKTSLWKQLLHYQFDVSKIRGQGYDGASNIRGKWNRLHALGLEECPYAYYVHCFAHRLQLALVCASREVIPVHQFFTYLVDIVNVVCASSKRHDELQKAKASEVEKLLELGEINSGKGQNQLGTLRRAGIIDDVAHTTFAQRGDAEGAWRNMQSFEFVFILHLIEKVMGKTEILSQALQRKSQDILNAMELVLATKITLNNYRNDG